MSYLGRKAVAGREQHREEGLFRCENVGDAAAVSFQVMGATGLMVRLCNGCD